MSQYKILLKILDCLLQEAPSEFTSLHPDKKDNEQLNAARAKAYIHLFLKVKCGITNFKTRHSYLTEGSQDGGVDAYYIDSENKKLYLIQSKFRTTEDNFTAKSVTADDLVKIEVNRILGGDKKDSAGREFNSKIQQLQKEWAGLRDQAKYNYKVIILGNLTKYNDEQIKRLLDNSDYEVFDFDRTYNELIFPLCSGTYFDPNEICITINLYKKEQSTLKQTIATKYGDYEVRITFVPVEEVAEIMLKYKNSLLKYNPRNYLSLSNNKINRQIKNSILEGSSNEFAIFNNGITVLAEDFSMTETTGKKYQGQIILKHPQIINGGQTAYTLSRIYEELKPLGTTEEVFRNKEVLFKIIVMREPEMEFIEKISDATNKQTSVEEADRRSNLTIQVKIQKSIYNEYGYLYERKKERKKGEFFHGLQSGYIASNETINRNEFIRAYFAFKGNPRDARAKGKEVLFRLQNFNWIIDSPSNYKKMFFAWKLLKKLESIEQAQATKDWKGREEFEQIDIGRSLRYGKLAIISAVGLIDLQEEELSNKKLSDLVSSKLSSTLQKWKAFEDFVKVKSENKDYKTEDEGFDFDNYYKGKTLNSDIKEFFKQT